MHYVIYYSLTPSGPKSANSRKEPHESAVNAPKTQPFATSLKSIVLWLFFKVAEGGDK
jgi:hypothetical protein